MLKTKEKCKLYIIFQISMKYTDRYLKMEIIWSYKRGG